MISNAQRLFLAALRAALSGQALVWDGDADAKTWGELFDLARQHKVLPMVYQSVYRLEQFAENGRAYEAAVKASVRGSVIAQTRRTQEFLELYKRLAGRGVPPVVVKGIVCRSLYPNPDHRASGDEDLYVVPELRGELHRALTESGLALVSHEDGEAKETSGDAAYVGRDGVLYLEVHDSLDGEAGAYRKAEGPFADALKEPETVEIGGVSLYTLKPSLHMLFLILHAFKHFVNSGVGVRQVCDLVVYAHACGERIDWEFVRRECRGVRAETFASALFGIGHAYLGFDCEKACFPADWLMPESETEDLLLDLLDAGIYGGSDMSRKHSSTITENAVRRSAGGKRGGRSALGAVFLPLPAMRAKFPYLKKYPFLLPAAWVQRVVLYLKETARVPGDSAADSIRIGARRVKLLEQYGVIGEGEKTPM